MDFNVKSKTTEELKQMSYWIDRELALRESVRKEELLESLLEIFANPNLSFIKISHEEPLDDEQRRDRIAKMQIRNRAWNLVVDAIDDEMALYDNLDPYDVASFFVDAVREKAFGIASEVAKEKEHTK